MGLESEVKTAAQSVQLISAIFVAESKTFAKAWIEAIVIAGK